MRGACGQEIRELWTRSTRCSREEGLQALDIPRLGGKLHLSLHGERTPLPRGMTTSLLLNIRLKWVRVLRVGMRPVLRMPGVTPAKQGDHSWCR